MCKITQMSSSADCMHANAYGLGQDYINLAILGSKK